jgi:glycosyltransferase involved in cell wall biosynthesis
VSPSSGAADPRVSVIIPAHDESSVIAGCLRSVLASTTSTELEVIVVCNGCTDDTAAIARGVSNAVRVLETDVAAKHAALNLGDAEASAPVRVYLDADTAVSPGAIEAVADLLEQPGIHAASPEISFDVSHCSRPARWFHAVWRQSPYFQGTTLGAGFYAMSAEGRKRFDRFPPVVGDDYFVAGLFAEQERGTATGHTYTPLLPGTLRSMLNVHVRHYGAHAELDEWLERHDPGRELPGRAPSSHGWLAHVARSPRALPGVLLYVAVKVASGPLGRRKHKRRDMARWNRDHAGRRAPTA